MQVFSTGQRAVERRQLTHPYSGYITVVVYKGPLQGLEVKLEYMVIYYNKEL